MRQRSLSDVPGSAGTPWPAPGSGQPAAVAGRVSGFNRAPGRRDPPRRRRQPPPAVAPETCTPAASATIVGAPPTCRCRSWPAGPSRPACRPGRRRRPRSRPVHCRPRRGSSRPAHARRPSPGRRCSGRRRQCVSEHRRVVPLPPEWHATPSLFNGRRGSPLTWTASLNTVVSSETAPCPLRQAARATVWSAVDPSAVGPAGFPECMYTCGIRPSSCALIDNAPTCLIFQ